VDEISHDRHIRRQRGAILRDDDAHLVKYRLKHGKASLIEPLPPDKQEALVLSHSPALAACQQDSCHI
jgi:hypothetical protein